MGVCSLSELYFCTVPRLRLSAFHPHTHRHTRTDTYRVEHISKGYAFPTFFLARAHYRNIYYIRTSPSVDRIAFSLDCHTIANRVHRLRAAIVISPLHSSSIATSSIPLMAQSPVSQMVWIGCAWKCASESWQIIAYLTFGSFFMPEKSLTSFLFIYSFGCFGSVGIFDLYHSNAFT